MNERDIEPADPAFPGPSNPPVWPAGDAPGGPPVWAGDVPGGPPPRRGSSVGIVLAWAAVALMVLLLNVAPYLMADGAENQAVGDEIALLVLRLQARHMIGAADADLSARSMMYGQAQGLLETGSVGQRQRFVVMAAELAGADEASARLAALRVDIDTAEVDEPDFELTTEQAETQRLLAKLYPPASSGAHALTDQEQATLREELGWFGDLALAPDGSDAAAREAVMAPARFTTYALMGVMGTIFTIGGLGFIGLIIVGVLTFVRRLKSRVTITRDHGIYAETFAIWLVLFFVMQLGAGAIGLFMPGAVMVPVIAAFFLSLAVLAWPCIRGLPWSQVRRDIGWTAGDKPVLEPLLGLAGYAMAIPIVAVGILLTLLLILVQGLLAGDAGSTFAPAGGPAHPIILELGQGRFASYLQVAIVGAVAAPIVEETFFRGVLYAHLRNGSRRLGTFLSVALTALIGSFVFAAIHPQGIVAVPALMSLAICFSLMREWRGTIVPAVVMHGVSNFLVLTMAFTLLSA